MVQRDWPSWRPRLWRQEDPSLVAAALPILYQRPVNLLSPPDRRRQSSQDFRYLVRRRRLQAADRSAAGAVPLRSCTVAAGESD